MTNFHLLEIRNIPSGVGKIGGWTQRSIRISKMIFNLLKENPHGLTIREIAKRLNICDGTVRTHLLSSSPNIPDVCGLREKIVIKGKRICLKI
jgi:hypothetical protein